MIPEEIISAWNQNVPWRESIQVEQDLIITGMVQLIYSDLLLASKLAFRGGTCLNKLFWPKPVRYSEDLDFVQTEGEKIGPTIKMLRDKLDFLFDQKPTWETRHGSFRLYYYFQPTARFAATQKIKIEINTREHFTLGGFEKRPLQLKSKWHSGEALVTTYTLEELLATKVRALYQRRKGRDLFDLWKSQELKPSLPKVVTMFLRYMEYIKKPIYRDLLSDNLQGKLQDALFKRDIENLIVEGGSFDFNKASDFVRDEIFALVPESKTKVDKKRL